METELSYCFPKVSIVIPSLNQGLYIEKTILSLINQNYPNLEIIIMDGGSIDETANIIDKFSEYISIYISETDSGQTHALIRGFELSTGEIMGWLCSDDMHEPHTLREVAEFFNNNPNAQVVFGDCSIIDISGNPIRPLRESKFSKFIWSYTHNFIPQPSTFWRSSIYQDVGGLNKDIDLAMDADLFQRFIAKEKIYHVSSYWSRFRTYPNQRSKFYKNKIDKEDYLIRERNFGKKPKIIAKLFFPIAKLLRIISKSISGEYFWGKNKPNFNS